MSTIASPRDPSTPLPRRINSSSHIPKSPTPTSSTRPSFDIPHSAGGSPNPNVTSAPGPSKRANRAALREYYNLKKTPGTPTLEVTDPDDDPVSQYSEVPPSELNSPNFNADAYVTKTLASSSLSELLRVYTRVLGEIRALDAEKKALVYDNYSKLISATETIRKMRSNMDPLNPMARTLDPAIASIYQQACSIREELRKEARPPAGPRDDGADAEALDRRRRTKAVAAEILRVPDRLRLLVREGSLEEARREWELPRRLLERWKEEGIGGSDVDTLLEEGDAILRDEDSPSASGRTSTE
ncbi:hypothetical protein GQ53DRAFT_344868 [Thozetella sp. PMI_491]|nr:hypothetical protein GQ53DRAFT_344868 [Thozetella sp. PMI_491]